MIEVNKMLQDWDIKMAPYISKQKVKEAIDKILPPEGKYNKILKANNEALKKELGLE